MFPILISVHTTKQLDAIQRALLQIENQEKAETSERLKQHEFNFSDRANIHISNAGVEVGSVTSPSEEAKVTAKPVVAEKKRGRPSKSVTVTTNPETDTLKNVDVDTLRAEATKLATELVKVTNLEFARKVVFEFAENISSMKVTDLPTLIARCKTELATAKANADA